MGSIQRLCYGLLSGWHIRPGPLDTRIFNRRENRLRYALWLLLRSLCRFDCRPCRPSIAPVRDWLPYWSSVSGLVCWRSYDKPHLRCHFGEAYWMAWPKDFRRRLLHCWNNLCVGSKNPQDGLEAESRLLKGAHVTYIINSIRVQILVYRWCLWVT